MRKPLRIAKHDHWRILCTELSPYETPFKFSYENLFSVFENSSQETKAIVFGKERQDGKVNAVIPFAYTIQKGAGETRELGVIHPHLVKDFVQFYADFDDLIIALCSKSRWSLRRPAAVASTYVPKTVFPESETRPQNEQEALERGPEEEAIVQDHASSYFAYSKHSFLYKFFESTDLMQIERKFRFCQKLDIAKCFSNIYTHTISWATKTKAVGKREINAIATFDARFDSIIRAANDNETHGILIGPEVSRIFAETLLQQVDLEIYEDCCAIGLEDGSDYTIRRYVDDYFVFHNDPVTLSNIRNSIANRLKHYKLYLNTSKESCDERPFLTELSVCKSELRQLLQSHFTRSRRPQSASHELSLFSQIRSIVKRYRVEYSMCSAYILSQLYPPLLGLTSEGGITEIDEIQEEQICEIVRIGFALFSIDPRFRTSFLLGKLLILISRAFHGCETARGCGISDTVGFETRQMLEGFVGRSKDKKLEISTLLLAMAGIPNLHPLPVELIRCVCIPDESCACELNYFVIVTLMDLSQVSAAYEPIHDELKRRAIDKVNQSGNPVRSCEILMLSLDLIASPFLNADERRDMIKLLFNATHKRMPTPVEETSVLTDLTSGSMFFEWTSPADVARFLAKKELAFTY